jgi:hypothetical protein
VPIKRTRGRKPFCADAGAGAPGRADAPNFNFNISHEVWAATAWVGVRAAAASLPDWPRGPGADVKEPRHEPPRLRCVPRATAAPHAAAPQGNFVALASDAHLLVGIDVAAPQQLRRGGPAPAGGAGASGAAGGGAPPGAQHLQPQRPLLEALRDVRDQLSDGEVGAARGKGPRRGMGAAEGLLSGVGTLRPTGAACLACHAAGRPSPLLLQPLPSSTPVRPSGRASRRSRRPTRRAPRRRSSRRGRARRPL